jgi:ABC-type uncharacterized transport system substrate-binding protein
MNRRQFIILLGSTAAWPVFSRAQERERKVGVLMHTVPEEPEARARIAAFQQGLREAGWSIGGNLRIDTRWSGNEIARLRQHAAELVAGRPDVLLAGIGNTTGTLQEASRTIPIVMAQTIDPVGAGNVVSLARPGTNATGFAQFEYNLSGKWLELLKEIAPRVKRVGVLRDPGAGAGIGQWAVIQAFSPALGVELRPIDVRGAGNIERDIEAFAREPDSGLITVVSGASQIHRELIVSLAARHNLPAVYPYRFYTAGGGLISYGPDLIGQYRKAAGYVDRILRGAKPNDLPVQTPNRYELVVNLKAAKGLALDVPPTLLARADEVIE